MKKSLVTFLTVLFVLGSLTAVFAERGNNNGKGKGNPNEFKLGVEVLLDEQKDLIKGQRVGLITNPTGVDQELNSIVDRLFNRHTSVEPDGFSAPYRHIAAENP